MQEAILGEKTSIAVGENTYTLRRLGIRDVFTFSGMIAPHAKTVFAAIDTTGDATERGVNLLTQIVFVIPELEQSAMKFIADLLGLTPDILGNPEHFPLPVWGELLQKIATHPDLEEFIKQLKPALGKALNSKPMDSPRPLA